MRPRLEIEALDVVIIVVLLVHARRPAGTGVACIESESPPQLRSYCAINGKSICRAITISTVAVLSAGFVSWPAEASATLTK
jgi:hypothetical protein